MAVKRAIMGDCSNDTSHALAAVAASLSEAPASAQEPEAAALPSSDSPAAEEWYEVLEEPPSPTVSSSSPSSPTEASPPQPGADAAEPELEPACAAPSLRDDGLDELSAAFERCSLGGKGSKGGEGSPAPPPPDTVAGEPWAYAVWRHPLRSDLRGVHCGGAAAWRSLVPTLPNGAYRYVDGTRLRRFASEDLAIAGYLSEASRHGAPQPPVLFDASPAGPRRR